MEQLFAMSLPLLLYGRQEEAERIFFRYFSSQSSCRLQRLSFSSHYFKRNRSASVIPPPPSLNI